MDAGGSPAGGNKWKDNGDGSFSILPQAPKELTYSMLDLYLMGLADPSEVEPFGLLEDAVPPAEVKDPYTGAELTAASFPHFASTPVTVKATRKTITIDDIIAANGARAPARKDSPQTLKLGIVLMVGATADDAAIAKAEAAMDPVATAVAPAFERATRGRGHLEVVTKSVDTQPSDPAGETPPEVEPNVNPTPGTGTTTTESGCTLTSRPTSSGVTALSAVFVAGLVARFFRRRRASAR
jgi:hypothetical protein